VLARSRILNHVFEQDFLTPILKRGFLSGFWGRFPACLQGGPPTGLVSKPLAGQST
jgi:hypothetical protein